MSATGKWRRWKESFSKRWLHGPLTCKPNLGAQVHDRRLVIPADYPWQSVSTIVSDRDAMMHGGAYDHYLSVGKSALENITAALNAAAIGRPSTILDMPCGHGRVARVLRLAFPAAEISVSDLDTDCVAFCAQQFDAAPLVSGADFSTLNFGKTFELIWVGSLITHLQESATETFIAFVLRHLSPGGVAVVSSHGSFVADRIAEGETYGIEDGTACRMVDDYHTLGFGYADYPGRDISVQHYGISIIKRDWIISAITGAGGRALSYNERVWDHHHDVVCFMRAA